MENLTQFDFYNTALEFFDKVDNTQVENIEKAADIIVECLKNGGDVHVFGTGHSEGIGMELANRAGSFLKIHKMELHDVVLKGNVSLEELMDIENIFERREGVGANFYDLYDIKPNDVFFLTSNSGRNGIPLDIAQIAKDGGHKTIVLTSMDHTSKISSRHSSGKRLFEFGDVVIDNCGLFGDALIELDNGYKICSISSITGAYICQMLITMIYDKQIELGLKPNLVK